MESSLDWYKLTKISGMGTFVALIPAHPEGESEKARFEESKSWLADTPEGRSGAGGPGRAVDFLFSVSAK